MLQFEELRLRLLGHEDALNDLADALGLEKMKKGRKKAAGKKN